MNHNDKINLKDNTPLEAVEKAMYLGVNITNKADTITEVNNIIVSTRETLTALNAFWHKTNCPMKWKLLVYNAIIISKLTYGLETLQINDNVEKK